MSETSENKKEADTMATQEATTTGQTTTKSGRGNASGVVSELTTFWTIKPGHEEDLRAAIARFMDRVVNLPPEQTQRTGLRDARFVIFDGGKRMLFATSFETDWDPYIDDAVLVVGLPYFIDWAQHLVEGDRIVAWAEKNGVTKLDLGDPKAEEVMKRSGAEFKAILQDAQVKAEAYVNTVGQYTMPEISKAAGVNRAFQQVLDDPAGAAALQAAPALKPLLDQAAS
jgi:hypothetical protein